MSGDILLRVELHDPDQARGVLRESVLPWIGGHMAQKRPLVAEFRDYEDSLTDAQRSYFHGVVLRDISAFARPNGEQFPLPVWKEYFRNLFLGFKTVTFINPITGGKSRRRVRISTEDLGVRAYAIYIDQVIAYAATELGIEISEPMPAHLRGARMTKRESIDQETGEIISANVISTVRDMERACL